MTRIALIIFLLSPLTFCAQGLEESPRHLDVFIGGGGMYYVGDLKDDQLPDSKFMTLFPYAGIEYALSERTSLRLAYMKGRLKGADQWGQSNPGRDFQFRSPLDDVHIAARINILKNSSTRTVSVGALVGAGVFWFKPEVYNGYWTDAQSLGTEGQYLDGDYPSPYALNGVNLKYGLEVTWRIDPVWALDLFWIHTHTFTDYIDDVSDRYPDPADVLSSSNPDLSGFVYRYIDGHLPEGDAFRGNPKLNDGYVNLGFKLRRTIRTYSGHGKRKKCNAYN
jgi:hypothetical protein